MSVLNVAMQELVEFVNSEIEKRDWSMAELARRADLTRATVGDVLGGRTRPGLRWYIGVARALGCSVDHLLRLAGELPGNVQPEGNLNADEAKLVELFRQMPAGPAREYFLQMAQGWAKESRRG